MGWPVTFCALLWKKQHLQNFRICACPLSPAALLSVLPSMARVGAAIAPHVSFLCLPRVVPTHHLSFLTSTATWASAPNTPLKLEHPGDSQGSPNRQIRQALPSPCGTQLCCRIWICWLSFIQPILSLPLCWAWKYKEVFIETFSHHPSHILS